MREACILAFLGWNSWRDIQKREISLVLTGIFGGAGLFRVLLGDEISWNFLWAFFIGLGVIAVSLVTRGAIGIGDGLVLLALSGVMRAERLLGMLFLGLSLCAVWAGILLMGQKKGKNVTIPFIPFLLAGYIGGLILWGTG